MALTKLVTIPQEVDDRLADFGTTRHDAARIALASLGARNDSIAFDAKTAKGLLGYLYGVRTLRQVFMPAGYEQVSRQNIESVYDRKNSRKIMFQTVDRTCVDGYNPQVLSEIGTGKEAVIGNAQGFLFKDMADAEREQQEKLTDFQRAEAWYFCAAFTDGAVSCELSRPRGVVDKQFSGFFERIFIIHEGDRGAAELINLVDDTPPIEIKPLILKR
jgi:hypothetical protein